MGLGASCCSPAWSGDQRGVPPGFGGYSSSRSYHTPLLLLLHRYNHLMSEWIDL